ncbi:MAG TPA: RagB/SusD family nutrient uptake outer membrane protein [Bacteroidetes bacterium]|nr:RagB/SusD family nutrient uptake outer membrane protein [Bacteroidota bacterium]
MKTIRYIVLLLILTLAFSCEKYLEEEPKSLLTAKYLETENGVWAALYSAYSDLRYFYGGEGALSITCAGTDEWQKGPDGNANINLYLEGMSTEGLLGNTWNWGYTSINTTNAVVKFAPGSGMTEAEAAQVMAEARYIRATWYFIIVQSYGDCPLNLDFISEPSTEAYRAPAADVYETIIEDLEYAKSVLPPIAEEPGRADAAAATHLLAKVYLARATHETAGQATDYQSAYDNAMELINNKGKYGLELLQDFADIHKPRNEHNSEVIFTVERNTDPLYNDAAEENNKNNRSSFFFRPHYQVCTTYGGLARTIEYGRPWIRVRPTNYLLDVVFAERDDDTRYHTSFQTVWLVNDEESLTDPSFSLGDTAIWLPGTFDYGPVGKVMNIYTPDMYYDNTLPDGSKSTVKIYPSLTKYDDIDRPAVNDPSVRPFIVHKFSETYLIAAEAAMYLEKPGEARTYLNVIRARAAYDPDRSSADNANAVQRITNATPAMTDIDEGISFILDERSRELAGEYMRWWDLVRTRTADGQVQLLYRIRNLEPEIPAKNTIQDFHVLYPIPQSQIDLTSNEFPQNEGY